MTLRTMKLASLWRWALIGMAAAGIELRPLPAAACFSDSDCNDGLFCTTDHCILFLCAHFSRDCNDFNECTQDSCNEAQNVCTHQNEHLTDCEDFNIFTTAEVCCGGSCLGIPNNTVVLGERCCVTANCPANQLCVGTICILNPTPAPTPTRTRTPTRTPTRTVTPTPDNRPALRINDVAGNEQNSGKTDWVFTLMLSATLNQQVTLHFATADGSAIAGSDYDSKSGNFTIPANTQSIALPAIRVKGDTSSEADEIFSVNLTNVSTTVRVADGTGIGIIVNDDAVPPGNPGLAALSPHDAVIPAGQHIPVTLTWTHPHVWRDLNTVDLRVRGPRGIIIWLRFDEPANTLGLIQPSDVTLGPAFPPGSAQELATELVAVVLEESTVQARGPDAPSVAITYTLRFETAAIGTTYLIDAAATDDSGLVQDFDTVGTISVVAAASCPGDCSGDGTVSVDEVVLGVSIALGATPLEVCGVLDTDASGMVEIGEVIAAVNAVLAGCDEF